MTSAHGRGNFPLDWKQKNDYLPALHGNYGEAYTVTVRYKDISLAKQLKTLCALLSLPTRARAEPADTAARS